MIFLIPSESTITLTPGGLPVVIRFEDDPVKWGSVINWLNAIL